MRTRGWQVLIIVGGILAVAGLYGVVGSFMVRSTGTIPIPPRTETDLYFIRLEFNVLGGGSLHVEYATTTGNVDVFALTEAQYSDYVNARLSAALYAARDSAAGSFDVSLPESGKYFVTIDHGDAFEEMTQEVWATARLLGLEPYWFLGGLGFLGTGIIALGFGVFGKRRAMRARMPSGPMAPMMGPPSDVIFFADRAPPEPPAPPSPSSDVTRGVGTENEI